MNLKEAYAELELSEGVPPEEAKKKYRELAKRYHPDRNKEPDAEAKLKKINEAYECIQNGKGNDRQSMQGGWNPFHQQQVVQVEHVQISETISFKESVLGCKKELKYQRQQKCQTCDGAGDVKLNNGCKKCGGKGQIIHRQHNMIMTSTCPECQGRSSVEECKKCHGEGLQHTDVAVHVSIPPGILHGSTLRLQNMGNYAGSMLGIMDSYTDAYLNVSVISEPGLSIEGKDVVSSVNIPLLDALKGCSRQIKTIFGQQDITIPPTSKNKEEVLLPKCGVEGTGNQRVILQVEYPNDVSHLIDLLSNNIEGQKVSA